MNMIYSNSVLNIVAMWGKNSRAGCYIQRRPLTIQPCKIAKLPDDGTLGIAPSYQPWKYGGLETPKDAPLFKRS